LFFVLLLRQLLKDLSSLRGAVANNYTTFPIKYGERKTRKLGILFVVLTFFPTYILVNYPSVGYMKYYFLISSIVLIFIGYFLWKSNLKKHYVLLHNVLKLMLLAGVLSLLFTDPSILIERVIDKLN
jgi:4-hydroxybenzoate polyprenyltransferase